LAHFTLLGRGVVATIAIHDLSIDMLSCCVCLAVSLMYIQQKYIQFCGTRQDPLVTTKGNVRDGTATLLFKRGGVGLTGTRSSSIY
jgi:hypothetical protein